MGRTAKPWYYAARDQWVIWRDGKKVPLAKGKANKKEAIRAYHALMASDKAATRGITLEAVAEAFLDAAQRDLRPLSVAFYHRHIKSFWQHIGTIAAADVRPFHVTKWLDAHPRWGPTTRHGAITSIKRMFRWAKRQGHIDDDPLTDMEKPTPRRREAIMTAAQVEEVLDARRDRAFRDLLDFMRLTGARPSEAMAIEARHVDFDGSRIVMESKTTHATGRLRVIYLNPEAIEMCRRLATQHPTGTLLRNTQGNPWTRNATACRFARLRKKLGYGREATLESFRHGFATDALREGVPIKTVAELLGHSSTAMVDRHYGHIHQHDEHLRDALGKVRPEKVTPATDSASHPCDPDGAGGDVSQESPAAPPPPAASRTRRGKPRPGQR